MADAAHPVLEAVNAGNSAAEVTALVDQLSRGCEARRHALLNPETPLQAALRLKRGDLVAALLVAGADPKQISRAATALAMCCLFGHPGAVRALLARGADPLERRSRVFCRRAAGGGGTWMTNLTAAQACLVNLRPYNLDRRLECVRALAEKGGAAVVKNLLLSLAQVRGLAPDDARRAARALVELGADVNAAGERGQWNAVIECARVGDLSMLRALRDAGASPSGGADVNGWTPLMHAAARYDRGPDRRAVVEELLRCGPREDLLRTSPWGAWSAADLLVEAKVVVGPPPGGVSGRDGAVLRGAAVTSLEPFEPWELQVLEALRVAGVSLKPQNQAILRRFIESRGVAPPPGPSGLGHRRARDEEEQEEAPAAAPEPPSGGHTSRTVRARRDEPDPPPPAAVTVQQEEQQPAPLDRRRAQVAERVAALEQEVLERALEIKKELCDIDEEEERDA